MAVITTEGFDFYNGVNSPLGVGTRWVYAFGNSVGNASSLVGGRFAGQAFRISGTWSGLAGNMTATLFFTSSYANFTVGFAFWPNTTATGQTCFAILDSTGGTYNMQMQHDPTLQQIQIFNAAGTLIASSGAATALNNTAWHYVEIEITPGSSTGQIRVYLDNNQFCNLTSQNLSANPVGGVRLLSNIINAGGTGTFPIFDDMYFCNVATRLTEQRIDTLRPASDSSKTWTPNSGATNFSRVNETVADGDTSYVQTAGVGNADYYTLAALPTTPGSITNVSICSISEKTDAGTRTINHTLNSGGTVSDGAALSLLSGYSRVERVMNVNPVTSAAWTAGDIAGLLIGPKLAS